MSSKKNLTGGKVFRKLGSGENHKHVKNRLVAESFVDDVLSKTPTEGVTLAKVLKVLGGARMQLQTLKGDTVVAMMRGNLRCSKGASKHADNPIMATVGTFVLLQTEDFGLQIISVMGRKHVNTLQTALKDVAGQWNAGISRIQLRVNRRPDRSYMGTLPCTKARVRVKQNTVAVLFQVSYNYTIL